MHEDDTRAVFVGGPIDGREMMLTGKPFSYIVAQPPPIPSAVTADIEWPKIVHHVYYRREDRFMDGDLIAYEYTGES